MKDEAVKLPYAARLLLTDKCNLECDFCLINANKDSGERELDTDEWVSFIEKLKEWRVFKVSLSGGEIFLREDIFVLLKKLRDNRMHQITLLTNGTLITEEIARQLNHLNIKNISISMDGLVEKHDKIRGNGAFQRTLEGIRILINSGINPAIAFTPTRNNYQDLGPLIDLLVSIGISALSVNTLTPEGRCLEIYRDIVLEFPQQVKALLDVLTLKQTQYPSFKSRCQMGFYYYLPQLYQQFLKQPEKYSIQYFKNGCGAATTSFVVSATGDVAPCEGLASFKGGNIREKDFIDIWYHSEGFQKIRALSKISIDQSSYCKDCKYIYLCDGGCRATALTMYKDLLAPSILCPFH